MNAKSKEATKIEDLEKEINKLKDKVYSMEKLFDSNFLPIMTSKMSEIHREISI